VYRRLIDNVSPSNRWNNARKFREKKRIAIYFLFKISRQGSVAAEEKRDKKKDQIKRENPQIGEALTRSFGRLLFLMASMDGKSWAPE